MGFVGWPLGLFLSAISSIFGILGKLFLKLAHNQRERQDMGMDTSEDVHLAVVYFYAGLLSMLVLNPGLAALAYCFASQSLLAPMAGLTIGWNTLMAPLILSEELASQAAVGAILIFTGCVLVGVSGTHTAPPLPVETLSQRFYSIPFIAYTVLLTALLVLLIHHAKPALKFAMQKRGDIDRMGKSPSRKREELPAISRACLSLFAGVMSGQLFFMSVTMRLLHDEMRSGIWAYPITYICIFGAISTAILGLILLNAALKAEDAVVVIYLYEASYIIAGAVSGLCFFQDMRGLATWHYVVYSCSLVLILGGIFLVSKPLGSTERLSPEDKEKLVPLLGIDEPEAQMFFRKDSYYSLRRASNPSMNDHTTWDDSDYEIEGKERAKSMPK